jgi:hypothetical protein
LGRSHHRPAAWAVVLVEFALTSPRITRSQRRSPPKVGRRAAYRNISAPCVLQHRTGIRSPCFMASNLCVLVFLGDLGARRDHPRAQAFGMRRGPRGGCGRGQALLRRRWLGWKRGCLGESGLGRFRHRPADRAVGPVAFAPRSPGSSRSQRRSPPKVGRRAAYRNISAPCVLKHRTVIRSPCFMASNLCVLVFLGDLGAKRDHPHARAFGMRRGTGDGRGRGQALIWRRWLW